MNRRDFIKASLVVAAGAVATRTGLAADGAVPAQAPNIAPVAPTAATGLTLPPLPYTMDALVPHLSRETLEYHYGKHHAGYLKKLNDALPGTEYEGMILDDIVRQSSGAIFNSAAQIWNHSFYWNCLAPNAGGEPTGAIQAAINADFGSFADFKKAFTTATVGVFGSGWGWLVKNADGKLEITTTGNAGCPLTSGQTPILTCDIWEHAYYIDYRNDRSHYMDAFWKLVNWNFASSNLNATA